MEYWVSHLAIKYDDQSYDKTKGTDNYKTWLGWKI